MILMIIAGLFFIVFGIFMIAVKRSCKVEFQAAFMRAEESTMKGTTNYSPIFQYDFQGKQYEGIVFGVYKEMDVLIYRKGKRYPILVNEKRPRYYVLHRRVRHEEIVAIAIGILFLAAAYW